MIDEFEMPTKPEPVDFEIAQDICQIIVKDLERLLDKTTEPKARHKLDRQIKLYCREGRRNGSGSSTAYERTRRYHDIFLHQLGDHKPAAIENGAVRRPYHYVQRPRQSVSPK